MTSFNFFYICTKSSIGTSNFFLVTKFSFIHSWFSILSCDIVQKFYFHLLLLFFVCFLCSRIESQNLETLFCLSNKCVCVRNRVLLLDEKLFEGYRRWASSFFHLVDFFEVFFYYSSIFWLVFSDHVKTTNTKFFSVFELILSLIDRLLFSFFSS